MLRSRRIVTGLMIVAALVLARAASAADAAHTLTVRLDWITSGYHVPFYLALAKGWYAREGLDVSVEPGNGSNTTIQLVNSGKYDLGEATLSNVAIARSKGMPLVSIAGFFRKGDLALMVSEASGVKGPADLKGKKIIYSAASSEGPFLDPFLAKGGLTRADVQLLNVDPSARVSTYTNGQADGIFGSPVGTGVIIRDVRPTHNILFADIGINLPDFGLFTTESMLKQKGDALRKFASVTAGAWTYAITHQDEAAAALIKARPDDRVTADLMKKQLAEAIKFLYSPATTGMPIGMQSAKDWADTLATLTAVKAIDAGAAGKPTDYFTNDYLDPKTIAAIGTSG